MTPLTQLRNGRGFSLRKVAIALNVADATIMRWEKGITQLPASAIPKLAELYGLTDTEILQLLRNKGEVA